MSLFQQSQKATGSANKRERIARSGGLTEWTGIPKAANDAANLSGIAKELQLVPRYDSPAAFGFADYLRALGAVSPSFAISTERVIELGFTGVEAKGYSTSGFAKEVLVSEQSKESLYAWADALGINGEEGIGDTSREIERLLRYDGNAFVHIRIIEASGAKKVVFNVLSPESVAISLMPYSDMSTNSICYAPNILTSEKKVKKEDVAVLPYSSLNKWAWSEVSVTEGVRVQETVLHVRNKQGGKYYGASFVQDILEACRIEYHYGVLGAKIAATETTAKFLIFFEEEEAARAEGGVDNFTPTVSSLRNVISNEGTEAQSFAAIEYPNGTKPPQVQSIDIARDTEWKGRELSRAMFSICARNGINPVVANLVQSVSGIGGNQVKDAYAIFSLDITSVQAAHEYIWSDIIYQIGITSLSLPPEGLTFGFVNRAQSFAELFTVAQPPIFAMPQ